MNRQTSQRTWKLAAGLGCALLAGLCSVPAGASTFVYDLTRIAPDVLPQSLPSSPWTRSGYTTDSVSDPSNILTLVDTGGSYGPFYTHNLSGSDINSSMDYEMRANMRITNQPSPTTFLFLQDMSDGTRYLAWAAEKVDPVTTRFWIASTTGAPLLGLTADVTGNDFLQVDLKKTGSAIALAVNDTTLITMNYTDLGSYAPRAIDFGNGSSIATGTAQLTGVSFGINEQAPLLIPEPSTVLLGAFGAGLLAWRRRRQA